MGWSGGPWPAHILALDLCVAGLAVLTFVRTRGVASLVPPVGTWLHFAHSAGVLPIPSSPLEWGASAIGLGFVLLIASLAVSYRARAGASERTDRKWGVDLGVRGE